MSHWGQTQTNGNSFHVPLCDYAWHRAALCVSSSLHSCPWHLWNVHFSCPSLSQSYSWNLLPVTCNSSCLWCLTQLVTRVTTSHRFLSRFLISDFTLSVFGQLLKPLGSPASIINPPHLHTAHPPPALPACGLSYSQLHQNVWGGRPSAQNSHALDVVFWIRNGYLPAREIACDLCTRMLKKPN